MEDKKNVNSKSAKSKELIEWLESISVAVIVVIVLFSFFFRTVKISGPSMQNTLFANDRIIISNMFYTPKCGDVIVISRNYNNEHTDVSMSSEPIIKRVIATEGMVVDIDFENGYVYVDGTLLKEDYIKNPTVTKWDVEFPLTVGKNQLFVLGDNRMESMDSRDSRIGLIDERYVLGKALFRVYRDAEHRSSFSEMFGGI
ncbi:MAG: signal peptidase I [Clostridia bacterium]|nr:signal peptidase I [Clostridia bacterium]